MKSNDELDEEVLRIDRQRAGLKFIDAAAWEGLPVPDRRWAVPYVVPRRQSTLCSGTGGVGKTLLLLQLCLSVVLSKDWLGMMPEPGPVIFVGAEDEADELHRRVADGLKHYNASFSDLSDLHLLSLAGEDATFGRANHDGSVEPTSQFFLLHEAALDIRPLMIVFDTASDIFLINENDRSQVRQAVGLLRGLAIKTDSAVIISSHPSLTGMSSGTGLSGSTAWHNSVRARMYLASLSDQDEGADPNLRELRFLKNNYGPTGEPILLKWQNGMFVRQGTPNMFDRVAAEANAEQVYLDCLEAVHASGREVSPHKSVVYAPAVFEEMPQAKAMGYRSNALKRAQERLFAGRKIEVRKFGPPSKTRDRIIRTEATP